MAAGPDQQDPEHLAAEVLTVLEAWAASEAGQQAFAGDVAAWQRLAVKATLSDQRRWENPSQLARVYETVLEYQPVRDESGLLTHRRVAGRRKGSGSYFTPAAVIEPLLEAALLPVMMARIRAALGFAADEPMPSVAVWTRCQREAAEAAILSLRILDPACGTGMFLHAAREFLAERLLLLREGGAGRATAEESAIRMQIAAHCLFGVDSDPLAADFCQAMVSGYDPRAATAPAAIRVGDALLLPLPESPFDVVLGNPPFRNAIEAPRSEGFIAEVGSRFPEIRGTADLAYYFLAAAHRWAKPDGAIGMVLPRAILNAPAAAGLRNRLGRERPPTLIAAPTEANLFPGAQVYVVLLALRCGGTCLAGHDRLPVPLRPVTITDANWWAPVVGLPVFDATPPRQRLGDLVEICASMTTGMAYDLVPFLADLPAEQPVPKSAFRLVTTGLIDPGQCGWGEQTCRYLKQRYERPIVQPSTAMPPMLAARLKQVRRPKVLVAGLSNRVEAWFDASGTACGAVSTYTLIHPRDDTAVLRAVCRWLNSPTVTELLQRELGALALGGGRITLSKRFLRDLPAPPADYWEESEQE